MLGAPGRSLRPVQRLTTTGGDPKHGSLATSVESSFNVETRNRNQEVVIGVTGELDLASSPALERELEQGVASQAEVVVVDLRQLDFMDSTGLSVLVRAHQRATETGKRFGVVRGPQQVQRLLSLTGVADRLTLADSPEELLAQG
jgi:anti-sigma B factor antagonist